MEIVPNTVYAMGLFQISDAPFQDLSRLYRFGRCFQCIVSVWARKGTRLSESVLLHIHGEVRSERE